MKEKSKSFTRFTTGALGLLFLLFIIGAVNMIAANLRIRADLTAERLYTLSKGSRAVLGNLDNDVTLKFYFSRSSAEMPMGLKTYADQVQDLLKEYELAGKGRVILEAFDPKPDSDAEEWAQRYGVEPQQTSMFGQPVYFGLVAVSGGREQVIPGFHPRTEATLEYDITRLITRTVWPEKPVIGVMSSLSVLGAPMNPMMMQMRRQQPDQGWAVFQEMRKDYTVREIAADAEAIEPDVKALVVVHPKNLSDKTLLAIDQFVLRGGRLIALVDPFCIEDFQANQQQQNPMMMQMGGAGQAGPSTLGKLFDAWGVTFDTSKIVADMASSTTLGGRGGQPEENPAFLSLKAANLDKKDALVAQLSNVMLPFSGAFTFAPGSGLTVTPLLMSSKDAHLVDQMNAQFGSGAMRSQMAGDGSQHIFAARLQGTFKTAFPEGVAGEDGAAATPPALTSGHGTVVLFGDADFISNQFCFQTMQTLFGAMMQPINENPTLFGNTVEQLAGREELIGVRSRGQSSRPFVKVDKLEAEARNKWQAQEETLQKKLQETQQRLSALQQEKQGMERLIISKEQQAEMDKFRKERADTQRELKNVRKNLNRDIERLGLNLKLINIALVPLLVITLGVWRGVQRRKR